MRHLTLVLCILVVCVGSVIAAETPSTTQEWTSDDVRKNPEQYFATDPARALDALITDKNSIVFTSTDARLNTAIAKAFTTNPSLINQDPNHRKFADAFFQLPGNFAGPAAQNYLTQTRGLQITAPPISGEVELNPGPPQTLSYGNNELAMDTLVPGTRIIINEAEKKFLICPPGASAECKGIDVSGVTAKDPDGRVGDLRPTLVTSGKYLSLTDKRGKTLTTIDESVLSVQPAYGAIDLPDGQTVWGIDRMQYVTERAGVRNEFTISLGVRDETGAPIRYTDVVKSLGGERILTVLGPGQRMAIRSATGAWQQVTSTAKIADYLSYDFTKKDSDILQTRTFVELDQNIMIKGANFKYQGSTTAGALIVSSKNSDGTPVHTSMLAYNGKEPWSGPTGAELSKDGYNVIVNRNTIHLAQQPVSVLLDGYEGSREFFLQAGTAVIDASTEKGVHTVEASKQRTEIKKVVQVPCRTCRGGYTTREVVQTEFVEASSVTMIDKKNGNAITTHSEQERPAIPALLRNAQDAERRTSLQLLDERRTQLRTDLADTDSEIAYATENKLSEQYVVGLSDDRAKLLADLERLDASLRATVRELDASPGPITTKALVSQQSTTLSPSFLNFVQFPHGEPFGQALLPPWSFLMDIPHSEPLALMGPTPSVRQATDPTPDIPLALDIPADPALSDEELESAIYDAWATEVKPSDPISTAQKKTPPTESKVFGFQSCGGCRVYKNSLAQQAASGKLQIVETNTQGWLKYYDPIKNVEYNYYDIETTAGLKAEGQTPQHLREQAYPYGYIQDGGKVVPFTWRDTPLGEWNAASIEKGFEAKLAQLRAQSGASQPVTPQAAPIIPATSTSSAGTTSAAYHYTPPASDQMYAIQERFRSQGLTNPVYSIFKVEVNGRLEDRTYFFQGGTAGRPATVYDPVTGTQLRMEVATQGRCGDKSCSQSTYRAVPVGTPLAVPPASVISSPPPVQVQQTSSWTQREADAVRASAYRHTGGTYIETKKYCCGAGNAAYYRDVKLPNGELVNIAYQLDSQGRFTGHMSTERKR